MIDLFVFILNNKYILTNIIKHGPIAQLGERIVRNDKVVGSIPIWSTIPIEIVPIIWTL